MLVHYVRAFLPTTTRNTDTRLFVALKPINTDTYVSIDILVPINTGTCVSIDILVRNTAT